MAISKKLLCILLASLTLLGTAGAKSKKKEKTGLSTSAPVTKQDENGEEVVDESPEAAWQFLEWIEESPEYVQKYEVVIEGKQEGQDWIEVNRLMTEDNSTKIHINPLLQPGLYRYKVITYDLIGIPEVESDWFEFNIYEAYIPQIRGISTAASHSSTIYLDELNDGILNISGRNLFETQKEATDISFTSYALVNEKGRGEALVPDILEFSDNNRSMKVQFDIDSLDTGIYNYVATDASGLMSEASKDSQLIVKFKKAVDFDVSAGYAIPVIVVGNRMKEYLNSPVIPLSATAKISLLPFKRKFGYLGLGATGTYSRLLTKTTGYDLDGNFITGHALFIYQLPIRIINKKTQKLRHAATLELHGGAGVTMFQNTKFHFPRNINSEPLNSLDISVAAGISGQIYVTNRMYVEAGADFMMPFMGKLIMGYVQPQICIGWQF